MRVPVVIHVTADVPTEDVDQLLDVPVRPFFEKLSRKFADDVYARLKSFVGKALSRQRTPHDDSRVLVLQDTTTGLTIALESDLPLAAYQQLFGMDPTALLALASLRLACKEWAEAEKTLRTLLDRNPHNCLEESMGIAQGEGCKLRVRFDLPAALSDLPIEILHPRTDHALPNSTPTRHAAA